MHIMGQADHASPSATFIPRDWPNSLTGGQVSAVRSTTLARSMCAMMRLPPPTGKLVWHCASRHRTPRSVGAVRGVETSGDGVAAVEASDQRCGFLHVLGRVDVAAVIAVGLIDEVPGQHRRMVLVLFHLGHAAKARACRLRNDPRRSGWLRIDYHGRSTDCRAPLAHSAHFGSQRTVLQPCSIAAAGAPKIVCGPKVSQPSFPRRCG